MAVKYDSLFPDVQKKKKTVSIRNGKIVIVSKNSTRILVLNFELLPNL